MKLLSFLLLSLLLTSSFANGGKSSISSTIVVDKSGHGGVFSNVQAAILSVPHGNSQWIKIHIKSGIYKEKVVIPKDKRFIYMEGEGRERASIGWGGHVSSLSSKDFQLNSIELVESATFRVEANNLVVKGITFKNIYNNKPIRRALAAYLGGDKASFHYCIFIGFQDTLGDWQGRHYFHDCYVEGSVDFIFGIAQSIYENCTLNTANRPGGVRWITAQGRDKPNDSNGFVFKSCNLIGPSRTFLGRAWRPHSRVIFYNTYMSDIVVPEGWDLWNQRGQEKGIVYVEVGCRGAGSNTVRRVGWEKKLNESEGEKYASIGFIDGEEWLPQQLQLI